MERGAAAAVCRRDARAQSRRLGEAAGGRLYSWGRRRRRNTCRPGHGVAPPGREAYPRGDRAHRAHARWADRLSRTGKGGEKGSGLAHILEDHEGQFADWGIARDAIPEFIFKLLREAEAIGKYGRDGVVYRTVVNDETRHFNIVVGDNGYIVTAHPLEQSKVKKVRPLR